MANISLSQYALILGANTVIGMAEKVGLKPPPPTISVRNLIARAGTNLCPPGPGRSDTAQWRNRHPQQSLLIISDPWSCPRVCGRVRFFCHSK